ncbi:MAG: YbaK/EbsC family protein [Alphaproteobacteria bacterium]
MSIERVKAYFQRLGLENRILEFPVSSATVELAAQALHCDPGRIAKTLSFNCNGETLLLVTAGDRKIDNAKYKQFFHAKAKMLPPQEALLFTGHEIGGVFPFAVPENVKIYLDISLKRFPTVFPACSSSNSAIELTPEELDKYTLNVGWVDICKEI